MTEHKSLKRRVRVRMAKTGERYTAARRQVLARSAAEKPSASPAQAGSPPPVDASTPVVELPPMPEPVPSADLVQPSESEDATRFRGDRAASDEALATRTGRTWGEWRVLLDAWGAADRPHPEIARWLNAEHGVDGWWSQELTVRYEMAIGRRSPGQRPDGFAISVSRTVAVPVDLLFQAFVDADLRAKWLRGASLRLRTATPHRTARFDWADGSERLAIGFTSKGDARSTVAIEHSRLPDPETAGRRKAFWRDQLQELRRMLEA